MSEYDSFSAPGVTLSWAAQPHYPHSTARPGYGVPFSTPVFSTRGVACASAPCDAHACNSCQKVLNVVWTPGAVRQTVRTKNPAAGLPSMGWMLVAFVDIGKDFRN